MSDVILPDSRLKDKKGAIVVDWPNLLTGAIDRVEVEPIFCFNCGKANGYVPTFMTVVSFLCQACSLSALGEYATTCMLSDEAFWKDVAAEMLDRFGRVMTHEELVQLGEQGRLGRPLELLARESPYKV